jgi:hypothetical protein
MARVTGQCRDEQAIKLKVALVVVVWALVSATADATENPFRGIDVVSLFAKTPGTVPSPGYDGHVTLDSRLPAGGSRPLRPRAKPPSTSSAAANGVGSRGA